MQHLSGRGLRGWGILNLARKLMRTRQASRTDDIPKPGNKIQTKGEQKVISGGSPEKGEKTVRN